VSLCCSIWDFSAQAHDLGLLQELVVKLWGFSLQLVSYGVTNEVSRVKVGAFTEFLNQLC
jgi:hypothetical protein